MNQKPEIPILQKITARAAYGEKSILKVHQNYTVFRNLFPNMPKI